ncbi:MAG TPA: class I SAM-dependent methyltransferase [Acidimicrobiia bacterium]
MTSERWAGPLTHADESVLARAEPPVLDIGCGPGRHVAALAERGAVSLGLDITPAAVAQARDRGASVLERSVFDRVPGCGRWASALLLDGNVGIGGDPATLLARVATLLRPGGFVLVEVESRTARDPVELVRLVVEGRLGPWFPWTRLGVDDLAPVAAAAGLLATERWEDGGRSFARLTRRRHESPAPS